MVTAGESSLLCHSQLLLDSDYLFQRQDISPSTHVEGEKNIVSLLELNTGLHTHSHAHIHIHSNTNMLLNFQHQSSHMFNHMSSDVMDPWHVLLFTLLVLFSPALLYCKSLPSPQKKRHMSFD